jgi:hypothetical protein
MEEQSVNERVRRLQASLNLTTSIDAIHENRALIDAELTYIKEQLKAVEALARANQAMCTHPNAKSYADPRYSGFDCPDCGAQR